MASVTVQVFEHSTARVGERLRTADGDEFILGPREHQSLAAFADSTAARYLSCGRRTVRFSSFVGLLQLGDLAIEILPKADRGSPGNHARWHRALVRMLRVVGDLGLEAHDEAQLRLDPGRLFELFIHRFLDECERLSHQGLARGYRTEEGNRTAFRGRLVVPRHVRENAANGARFYVASPVYDHRNLPNLVLHEALRALETLPISGHTRARARGLRHAFPDLPQWTPDHLALQRLRLSRNTKRYGPALRLARLIIFSLTPDVRHGSAPLLALLFDMNLLWERYVAALARRLRLPGLEVRTQDSRGFWRLDGNTRTLRPDITVRDTQDNRVLAVLDSKWKVPSNGSPSASDVKQMFCYHEVFACSRSALAYPSSSGASAEAGEGSFLGRQYRVHLSFLSIDGDTQRDLRSLIEGLTSGSQPTSTSPTEAGTPRH
jgi:5-methylcytosine-specific restriction enzyme subunit McrC